VLRYRVTVFRRTSHIMTAPSRTFSTETRSLLPCTVGARSPGVLRYRVTVFRRTSHIMTAPSRTFSTETRSLLPCTPWAWSSGTTKGDQP